VPPVPPRRISISRHRRSTTASRRLQLPVRRTAWSPHPSAQQQALDSFWNNDPNRPPGTGGPVTNPSGGSSDSGGGSPAPVALTPAEIAAFQASGLTVTAAGSGTYLVTSPGETIVIPQQAPPPPPPNHAPLPGPPQMLSGAGANPGAAPADPNGVSGPPQVTKPEAERPSRKVAKPIVSGFGRAVDELLNKSPSLRAAWETARKNGWEIQKAEPGSGSRADPNTKPPTVYIDLEGVKPGAKYTEHLAALIAHEIGHAATPYQEEIQAATRDEFVTKNVAKDLAHEGAAAFENCRARDEIMGPNKDGPDINIRGGQDTIYDYIYEQYKAGHISESEAKAQMGAHFADEGLRVLPNGQVQTYEMVFTERYEDIWDDREGH
jgi:hypothetical protein